ncbi:MAG: hypothetical protein ASARMPREDX12_002277 [Alectoria sarmentosa]|nr:MAG: hypothetical protein ASARMPREDX12_002277 [Alectoria sarmentosa]
MAKDPHQIRCRIRPIIWTRAQFEQRHGDITIYAKQLIEKNSTKSIDVDKEDVVHIWWWLIDDVFPKGDPDREQYMSQRNCPNFHEFWFERDGQNRNHEPQDDEGFHRAHRPTTRAERRTHPGVVVLAKDGLETLVPGIEFAALEDIEYSTFVRGVLEANSKKIITLREMQLLWNAMVHNIFRFECRCVKEAKVNEVLVPNLDGHITLTDSGQSMVVNGFGQAKYDQLVLDVRSGVPPTRPTTLMTLPIHGSKRPRETRTKDSGCEIEDDCFVGAPEDDSQMGHRPKKRPHVENSSNTRLVLDSEEGNTPSGDFRHDYCQDLGT